MTKSFDLVRDQLAHNGDVLFHSYIKVERHFTKKNHRPIKRNMKTGKPFIGKSSGLIGAENYLTSAYRMSLLRHNKFTTIDGPIWCVFLFFFPHEEYFTKKGQVSQRLGDLSNLYELPQDALQKAGVIKDDKLICAHDLSRRLPGPEWALETFIFRHSHDAAQAQLHVVK